MNKKVRNTNTQTDNELCTWQTHHTVAPKKTEEKEEEGGGEKRRC